MQSSAPYWSDLAARWVAGRPQRLWRRHSDAVNHRLLEEFLDGERVAWVLKTDAFDEAVAEGVCATLGRRADNVVAMDLALPALAAARARSQALAVACADARHLPFRSGSIDAVVSLSTLDHFERLEDISDCLAELARVLRPGGRLVITLDNPRNPAVALRNTLPFRWLNRWGLVPYQVGVTCRPATLRAELERAGFEVVGWRTTVHVLRVAAVAASHLVDRLGVRALEQPFLRWLMSWEQLDRLPTRHLTGHFICAGARRIAAPAAARPRPFPGS